MIPRVVVRCKVLVVAPGARGETYVGERCATKVSLIIDNKTPAAELPAQASSLRS